MSHPGMRVRHLALAVAVTLAAATCGGRNPVTTVQLAPATLAKVAGDGQSGTVAQPLAARPAVEVADTQGRGVPGVTVTWTVLSGGGAVSAGSTTTDASGQTSVSWTLGAAVGSNSASAGVAGLTAVTFTATAVAGPASALSFRAQPGTVAAGTSITPAVQVAVQDGLGNAVSSTASITVALGSGTGTAGAHLNGGTTANAVNGLATFSTLSIDSVGTGYRLTARATGLTGATSNAFAVTPGSAAALGFAVQPSTTTAGAVIAPPVRVAIRDAVGNTVTTATASVTLAITPGTGTSGAVLGGTLTRGTVNGVATFNDLTIDQAGSGYTLTASAAGLTSATSTAFTVSAAGAHTSYATSFPLTENPISEGGRWINGGTVGLDWTNVSTTPGLAIGHQVGASYTDATAILTGTWGPDQMATATVYSVNQRDACYQEVELRLRSAISAHVNSGYEISFKASQSSSAYLIIVRWNGALGNFSYLFDQTGTQYGLKSGDTVSAKIVGNVITAYKNGVQMGQATDNTFTTGTPGMGFNLENAPTGCSGTNGDYGYTSFAATDSVGP